MIIKIYENIIGRMETQKKCPKKCPIFKFFKIDQKKIIVIKKLKFLKLPNHKISICS